MKNRRFNFYILLNIAGLIVIIAAGLFIFTQFRSMLVNQDEFSQELYNEYIEDISNKTLESMTYYIEKQYPILYDKERLKQEAGTDWFWQISAEWLDIVNIFNFAYLYYMEKVDDTFIFIMSSFIQQDKNSELLGEPVWDGPYSSFFDEAWETKQPTHSPEPFHDEWGTAISSVLPIVSGGEIIGLLCVDYDISFLDDLVQQELLLQEQKNTMIRRISVILAVSFLVIFAIMGYMIWLNSSSIMVSVQQRKIDERVQAILNAMPLCTVIWNINNEAIDCNEEAVRLFDFSRKKEFIDNFKKLSPEYQPDGRLTEEKRHFLVKEAFETGYCRDEWMHQKINGELIPCDVTFIRIKLQDEFVVAAYMQDQRELKAAIEEMSESDERARAILDAMPLGSTIWSKNGELVDCNEAVLRLFDFTDKKKFIDNFDKLTPEYQPNGESSIKIIQNYNDEVLEKGVKNGFEWMQQDLNGEPIPCYVNLARIKMANDFYVATYVQDLREVKAAMAKVRESDERMKIIFDTAPIGCLMFDKDYNIYDCNQEIVNIFELSNKQEYLSRFFKLSPKYQPCGKESEVMMHEINSKVFEEGYYRTEWMHQTLDGKPIPCEVIQVRVKYKDEYAIAAYVTDLREQNALLNKLNNEYEKASNMVHWYESILDTIPFLLSVTDTNMNLMFINKAAENYLEVKRNDVMGQHCSLWQAEICHTSGCGIYRLRQGLTQTKFFQRGFSFQVDGDILKNLDGETIGYVEVVQDITQLEQSTKRQAEAEAASIAKSKFLARVSHEVRTPMNAILGITEIQLQNENLSHEVKEALGTIYNSGYLLLGIINDILDLSKIEAGKLELTPVNYDVASLINDTVHLNVMRFDSKPIEFMLHLDENIPSTLLGDDLRIKQILNNLLSNAFKYTDSGEILFSIAVETMQDSNQIALIFIVKDTGQGMTKEQTDKLFDEYTRFNIEANRSTIGTGLGMSITKYLVQMMNGEINVVSEPGKGSLFTVRLPQGKIDDGVLGKELTENLQSFRAEKSSQIKKAPQIVREYMPYGRVLIVDDVDTNLYVGRGLMAPYGLSIETASSGFEAIDKIKSGSSFDIIFMDHFMPRMDGIEAVKIIRGLGYSAPIIALTANALSGQSEMFMANGFDGFISKPIDIRQLNTTLNKFIRDRYPNEVIEAARLLKNNLMKKKTAMTNSQPLINLELAGIFIRDAERTIDILEAIGDNNYRRTNDMQTYIISVHAMKSALANIGESELSDFADKLEQAGREGNTFFMINETQSFIDKLKAVVEKIKPKDNAVKSVDAEENSDEVEYLREKLSVIKTACADYDKKTAKEALNELKQRTWNRSTKDVLENISENLLHSDFEKAAEITALILDD